MNEYLLVLYVGLFGLVVWLCNKYIKYNVLNGLGAVVCIVLYLIIMVCSFRYNIPFKFIFIPNVMMGLYLKAYVFKIRVKNAINKM